MWGNMTLRVDLNKLQIIQNRCVQVIKPNSPVQDIYKDLGILTIDELLKLENCKLWYKYYKGLLPVKLQKLMSVGSSQETLIKAHNYNTHRKGELNTPKAHSEGYRKSFLIKGLWDFSSLPQVVKNSVTLQQFVIQCKKYITT